MPPDFSLLDRPDILGMMFYPRPDRSPAPSGADDLFVPVADGVSVHARFHPFETGAPVVLFFHGNGEVVADYDDIAPVYHHFGMSLLVADYRGYGRSDGRPSFTSMLVDAHAVKAAAFAHLDQRGCSGGRYLMGRSLGALSAVELAATDAEGFRALILESGAAGIRGWSRFARPGEDQSDWEALAAAQRERLASITLPLLTIHGAWDELIPVQSAVEVQEAIGSKEKELVVIPGAGHNDLLAVGIAEYFDAITSLVARIEDSSGPA
jgi:pimeloyl-ACP methyl ester carboxylesterase